MVSEGDFYIDIYVWLRRNIKTIKSPMTTNYYLPYFKDYGKLKNIFFDLRGEYIFDKPINEVNKSILDKLSLSEILCYYVSEKLDLPVVINPTLIFSSRIILDRLLGGDYFDIINIQNDEYKQQENDIVNTVEYFMRYYGLQTFNDDTYQKYQTYEILQETFLKLYYEYLTLLIENGKVRIVSKSLIQRILEKLFNFFKRREGDKNKLIDSKQLQYVEIGNGYLPSYYVVRILGFHIFGFSTILNKYQYANIPEIKRNIRQYIIPRFFDYKRAKDIFLNLYFVDEDKVFWSFVSVDRKYLSNGTEKKFVETYLSQLQKFYEYYGNNMSIKFIIWLGNHIHLYHFSRKINDLKNRYMYRVLMYYLKNYGNQMFSFTHKIDSENKLLLVFKNSIEDINHISQLLEILHNFV